MGLIQRVGANNSWGGSAQRNPPKSWVVGGLRCADPPYVENEDGRSQMPPRTRARPTREMASMKAAVRIETPFRLAIS